MNELIKNIGQLLCVGFEGQECGPELRGLLRDIRPGGVIFFQRNIATVEQFRALVADVREELKDSPPFLAIDQEGGQVDRFRELLGSLPSARDAAQAGLAFELGEMAGRELAAFGLNVDFAPVLDIGSAESETVLGTRTASDSPEEVTQFAELFLHGLDRWNVLGCGKHFPGLGAGKKDSHIGMPVIDKSADALWSEDLIPFRQLAVRLPMVMVAHCWYPTLEAGSSEHAPVPASLSENIVTELLRQRVGYDGLIVCDDLEMGGALEGRNIEEAATDAVRAGCDILLVCRRAENVVKVQSALVAAANSDSTFQDLVTRRAAARIQKWKKVLPEPTRETSSDIDVLRHHMRTFRDAMNRPAANETA